ncbi:MAG: hypothetical protein RLZZ628_3301 [Bacteroidota bacterium]
MRHSNLLFYTYPPTTRTRYIVDFIFTNLLGIHVLYADKEADWLQSPLPKIWYGKVDNAPKTEGLIVAQHHSILTEKGVNRPVNLHFEEDGLAHAFFELSRYEEYIAKNRDIHGRFTGVQSHAFKKGYLHRPIVHEIAEAFKQKLSQRYPNLSFKDIKPCFLPTYDIDAAWRYTHKGWGRNFLAISRDILKGDFKNLRTRMQVQQGRVEDPDFVFSYLDKLHQNYSLKPIFFWLLGDYGKYDINIAHDNGHLQDLIREIANQYEVGIHPSYRSNQAASILKMEIHRLNQILKSKSIEITSNRQHFLKLTLPETYRRLLAAGITNDYTMGYADQLGFRAGVAIPFNWYDIENEMITDLKIHSFQVMDVTLQQYLKLSPQEAIEAVKPLIASTKRFGGTFTTLWHNSSLSETAEWRGWRAVYETIIQMAS